MSSTGLTAGSPLATPAGVVGIMEIPATLDVTPMVEAANNMMVTAFAGVTSLTVEQLTDIQNYLAAHLVAIRQRIPNQESIKGEYSYNMGAKLGMGLEATRWGQVALALDTSKTLHSLQTSTISVEVQTYGPS